MNDQFINTQFLMNLFTTSPPQASFGCITAHNITNSQLASFDSSVGIICRGCPVQVMWFFFFKKIEGFFFRLYSHSWLSCVITAIIIHVLKVYLKFLHIKLFYQACLLSTCGVQSHQDLPHFKERSGKNVVGDSGHTAGNEVYRMPHAYLPIW